MEARASRNNLQDGITEDLNMKKLTKDDELQKVKIIAHLDEMVETIKKLNDLADKEIDIPEGGTLSFCGSLKHGYKNTPYYQTYTGLKETAKALGLPCTTEIKRDDEYEEYIEIRMMYKGVMFLELEEYKA